MGCEQDTAAKLRARGQKVTPQRLLITSVLRHQAGGHLPAGEILARVKERFPYIDISTVYRTLATLRELRLVAETDAGGGERSFEWLREPHHHLVCRSCGQELPLPGEHLRTLAAALRQETGFEIDLDHLALAGLCGDCVRAARGNGGG